MRHEGSSCAPVRCKSYSYDVNQQAQSLTAWEQHYNQHSKGHFFGYLDEVKLPQLHLFEEFTNRTLVQQCWVNPQAFWVGFSLQTQRPKVDGLAVSAQQIMVRPAHQAFELFTPESFQIFGVVIDQSLLAERLSEEDYALWQHAKVLTCDERSSACWQLAELIGQALNHDAVLGARLNDARSQRYLRPLLINHVVDRLSEFYLESTPAMLHASTRRRALKRIVQYIEREGCYPDSIAKLCQIACVSRRTLQYVFEQELCMTPLSYLRDCRLNQIRRRLIDDREPTPVCELALQHGFYHLGSFHHYYKALFGETPSQTRHRAQGYRVARSVLV